MEAKDKDVFRRVIIITCLFLLSTTTKNYFIQAIVYERTESLLNLVVTMNHDDLESLNAMLDHETQLREASILRCLFLLQVTVLTIL